jgi:hypothetical protein
VRRADSSAKRPYDNELIPALKGVATSPGCLLRNAYSGEFDWVPQLHDVTPQEQTVVKGLVPTDGAQQFTGYLTVPVDGVYQFALTTGGKAVVRLHDALLINADTNYTADTKALSGTIALQAGVHPLRINYLAGTHSAPLTLEWQVPGGEMTTIPSDQFCIGENPEE